MAQFINPFTDWGFKHIFGQEIHKEMLIKFLNDLLEGERSVADVQFQDKEQLPLTHDSRGIVYDIFCKGDDGEEFIVEMQNSYQARFLDRSLYYASRAIVGQMTTGQKWDYHVRPVYVVCFLSFNPDKSVLTKLRTDVSLCDTVTGVCVNSNIRLIYLVLPLFDKHEPEECESDFERWIYILNNMNTLARMPFEAQDAVWKRLAEIADVSHLQHKDREKYEESCRVMWDYYATMKTARDEGEAIGEVRGEARGLVKGEALGIKKANTDTARKLKELGVSVVIITNSTGLTAEEIAKL